MFKKKSNIDLTLKTDNKEDFETLEKLIKDGWSIKETKAYTAYFIHITLQK